MKINNTAGLLAQYMLDYKYNFSFLNAAHNKVRLCRPEIIITGSSHALNGIVESAFSGGCANLSMHSQDIYYDMINVQHAVQDTDGTIKKCIIVLGYYIVGQDLSKSEKWGHKLIREVYFPLFRDSHHWKNPECDKIWENFESDLKNPRDVKQEAENILNRLLWNGYYNEYKERKSGVFDWNGRTWKDLTFEERELAARQRTMAHNKFMNRHEVIVENKEIFIRFIQYLHTNCIHPIVTIMPHTTEYRKYILAGYKDLIANIIDDTAKQTSCPIDFYDLNEYDLWMESDYIDTDHLSLSGAEKASHLLNELAK